MTSLPAPIFADLFNPIFFAVRHDNEGLHVAIWRRFTSQSNRRLKLTPPTIAKRYN